MVLDFAIMLFFPAAVSFAASMDLLTMTIPNRISLFLVFTFFLLAPFAGLSFSDIAVHVMAGVLMLLVAMLLFALGWIGGGDAKIFACVALWFGFEHLLSYIFVASILGGFLTLAILFWRQISLFSFLHQQEWALRLHDKKTGIPYGVSLGLSALIIYPDTIWMRFII